MQSTLLLDVVIREGAPVFQLLPSEDQTLLVRRNSLLILNLSLNVFDSIVRLNFQSNSFPGERLHEDLHPPPEPQDQMQSALLLDVVVGERTSIFQLLPSKDQTLLIWRNTLLILYLSLDIFKVSDGSTS